MPPGIPGESTPWTHFSVSLVLLPPREGKAAFSSGVHGAGIQAGDAYTPEQNWFSLAPFNSYDIELWCRAYDFFRVMNSSCRPENSQGNSQAGWPCSQTKVKPFTDRLWCGNTTQAGDSEPLWLEGGSCTKCFLNATHPVHGLSPQPCAQRVHL